MSPENIMQRQTSRAVTRILDKPPSSWRAGTTLLLVLSLLAACGVPTAEAKKVALLVGVGSYQSKGVKPLAGPPHDVAAMADVLVRRWGFAKEDVRTLVDAEATKAAILSELDALERRSAPGDEILFYFSGHGTSSRDPRASLPVPQGSGAIIPWDAKTTGAPRKDVLESLIVGRDDLVPRIKRIDKERKITLIFDSCFSGSAAKSLSAFPTRYQDFSRSGVGLDEDPLSRRRYGSTDRPPAEPWPYDEVFFLAASSDSEVADDIPESMFAQWPTLDGRPHGAFTDALLRVLQGRLAADIDGNRLLSHEEVKVAVAREVARGHRHVPQSLPQAKEDKNGLAQRTLFGGAQETARPSGKAPPYRVRIEAQAPALRERLSRAAGLELVQGPADLVVRGGGGRWLLSTEGGDGVSEFASNAPDPVFDRVMQLSWFHQLSWRGGLANPFKFRFGLLEESRGNRFFNGEKVELRLEPERQVWPVILYVDATGQVDVLYPYVASETTPLAAGRPVTLPTPGTPVLQAKDPLGTDLVVAYGFTTRPAFLDRLVGRVKLEPNESLYQQLLGAVAKDPQGVATAALTLRTQEPPSN